MYRHFNTDVSKRCILVDEGMYALIDKSMCRHRYCVIT